MPRYLGSNRSKRPVPKQVVQEDVIPPKPDRRPHEARDENLSILHQHPPRRPAQGGLNRVAQEVFHRGESV